MEIKNVRAQVLSANSENVDSRKVWLHCQKSFTNYTANMPEISDADKLNLLINHVDASVYKLISEVITYDDAIKILEITKFDIRSIRINLLQITVRRNS